ncbi:MAG TPA: phosphonate ABC transporter ATP-binding protein [Deferribacteraceae bacterium]|nr:phosphonate ABC transporter ATP-binding protein [Deferribacteraceae bacterium]
MLILENLIKKYGSGDLALNGVSLRFDKGEIVALIGPSGAGKSTLIRCVNRLVEPTSGSIDVNGKNIASLKGTELRRARRKIGMIFQEYALVERLTVMENILSGRLGYMGFWKSWFRKFSSGDVAKALNLLERVGLSEHFDKRADALSGGQRQRVGIARALLQEPDLLLVDEPTASLDPKTARQIMRQIKELCSERNLLAVINLHDVGLAKMFSDRIIGLRKGRVVFDGTPDELNDTILTEIYGEEDWSGSADKKKVSAQVREHKHMESMDYALAND